MTFTRRSFFAVLAGAACSVLGAVYGVPDDEKREYPYWKSEVKEGKLFTVEELESSYRGIPVMQTKYMPAGRVQLFDMNMLPHGGMSLGGPALVILAGPGALKEAEVLKKVWTQTTQAPAG